MKKTLTALLLSGCLESDFKDAGHKPEENPCDTAVEDTAQDTADCVEKVIQAPYPKKDETTNRTTH